MTNPQVSPQAGQTAAQINGPQVGAATSTAKPRPLPARPPQKPAGWWSCRDFKGSIPGVIKGVQDNTDILPHWKTAIIEDLKILEAEGWNFVYLDVHFQVTPKDQAPNQSPGKRLMHYDATPDKVL